MKWQGPVVLYKMALIQPVRIFVPDDCVLCLKRQVLTCRTANRAYRSESSICVNYESQRPGQVDGNEESLSIRFFSAWGFSHFHLSPAGSVPWPACR